MSKRLRTNTGAAPGGGLSNSEMTYLTQKGFILNKGKWFAQGREGGRLRQVPQLSINSALSEFRVLHNKNLSNGKRTSFENLKARSRNLGSGLFSLGRVRPVNLPRGVFPSLKVTPNNKIGEWVFHNKATASEAATDPTSGDVHDSSMFDLDPDDEENLSLILDFTGMLVPRENVQEFNQVKDLFAKTWKDVARAQAANGSYLELHSMGFRDQSTEVTYLDRNEIKGPGSLAFRQIIGQGVTNGKRNRIFLKTRVTLQHVNDPARFVSQIGQGRPNEVDTEIAGLQNYAKGKWAGEPDVVQWTMDGNQPVINIFELKIGAGKTESNNKGAHEYNQLIRVKRAFDNYLDYITSKIAQLAAKPSRNASEQATLQSWNGWVRPVVRTWFVAFLKGSAPSNSRRAIMFGRNNDLERKFTSTNEMIKLSHWRQIREINGEQFCQVTGINYPMISAFIDLLNHQRVEQFKMVLDNVFNETSVIGRAYKNLAGRRYNTIKSLVNANPNWIEPVGTTLKRVNSVTNNKVTAYTGYTSTGNYRNNTAPNAAAASSYQPNLQSLTMKRTLLVENLMRSQKAGNANKVRRILNGLGPKSTDNIANSIRRKKLFFNTYRVALNKPDYLQKVLMALMAGQSINTIRPNSTVGPSAAAQEAAAAYAASANQMNQNVAGFPQNNMQ